MQIFQVGENIRSGQADATPEFDAAIRAARNGESIFFRRGMYRFKTPPRRIGTGVFLIGEGNASPSPNGFGTQFFCDYAMSQDDAFLVWDGSDPQSAAGAGGGVYGINIIRGAGFTGGDAVLLTSGNDVRPENHRCGWFYCENVLVVNEQQGAPSKWGCAFRVDGSKTQTGIRDTHIHGCNFFGCETALKAEKAINFYWSNGQTGPAKVEISGANVYITNVNVNADVSLDVNDGSWLGGRVGANFTVKGVHFLADLLLPLQPKILPGSWWCQIDSPRFKVKVEGQL